MSVAEWVFGEAAIRHIARALDVSPRIARRELIIAAAERSVDAADRRDRPIHIAAMQPRRERDVDVYLQTYHRMRLEEVRFRRAQLEARWPLPGATKAETPTPEAPPKHPGGRTWKYDWIGASAHMTAYIVEEAPSSTDMKAELQRWFIEDWGKAPDIRSIEKWVEDYEKALEEIRRAAQKRPGRISRRK